MSHYNVTRRMKTALCVAYSTATDSTVATNSPVPLDSVDDLVGTAASGITISGNAITLPTGYWWFVKGSPQCYCDAGWIRYAWRDASSSSQYGRSGFLTTQKTAHLFGGDELATCLLDCTSSSVSIKLNIEGFSASSNINHSSTTHNYLSGRTRVLLWRLG
jgi:hypothetical protein